MHVPFQVLNTAVSSLPHYPLSSFARTTLKPALGLSFAYMTDGTLWLSRAEDVFEQDPFESSSSRPNTNRRDEPAHEQREKGKGRTLVAEMQRSSDVPTQKWCSFRTVSFSDSKYAGHTLGCACYHPKRLSLLTYHVRF